MTRMTMFLAALALGACSNSTTTTSSGGSGSSGQDGSASNDGSSGSVGPCGSAGVYGTFQIKGTLPGSESICGLSLGSFDGGTLTVAQGSSSGATVTVTGSGAGHIDVSGCAATVNANACTVKAPGCTGSTDKQATVSLDLSMLATTVSGTSQLGFNGCQAPGLSFTGTR